MRKEKKVKYQKGFVTIARYLVPHKRALIILAGVSVASAIGNAATPYLGGKLFDALLGNAAPISFLSFRLSPFVWIIGIWLFARLITDSTEREKNIRQERMTALLHADYIVNGFSRLLTFPIAFHKKRKIGEVLQRIERASNWLDQIVNRILIDLLPQFFSIFIAIAVAFTIKPILAALLTVAVLVYTLILIRVAPALSRLSHTMHRVYSRAHGDAYDTVMNVHAVKQATAERYEQKKLYRNFNLRAARAWDEYILIGTQLNFSQRLIITLTQFLLFVYSVYLIRGGALTIGELVAFNGYAALLFGPFVTLGRNWDLIQNGIAAIARAEEVLRTEPEPYIPQKSAAFADIQGEVEFRNVRFRYGGRAKDNVLNGISFFARPGKSIALVGESGVGKTTLTELISRYYRPSAGKIFIDGHPLETINLLRLRSAIAVVPQEILLFNDSVKNNIRYGKFGATDEEVMDAARAAHADEFIERFGRTYNQIVGERGIRLSTGQKQRIAIARAILRNPKILILDEPTSALDARSEKFISESLEKLMQGKTTFIIAHRLSTVRKADMILVLEKGVIAEQGTHQDLIKIPDGKYRRLYEMQIGLK
ncbi:MAG: ABC transporter-like protein [Parcubacteria group bacterium Gr01-1014_33]|nr:MAG: ABC transporter-like protein [Parcubacteria group bacterium Gr01-1014_33]